MNIKKIINGYLGSTQLNSIYRGLKLIWPKFNKYLIGGTFNSYLPNINLYEDQKDSILIARTYNGATYESPPFNGLTNNILVTLDNSTQIDPEFSVMKINRLNSNVSQMDYVQFPRYSIEPGKTMEMSFWYYGTYGTAINIYAQEAEVYVERWDASTNAYITNNSRFCTIPVTTNTWQYVKVRATNTHATVNKRGIQWLRLHDNQLVATLSNTEYWKITCMKHWYVESVTKNKIIRLNSDYSVDNTWYNNDSYTSGAFWSIIYNNKKVYAAGDPALDGGLVRFNLDGTKDTSFNIGTGFNDVVRNIIIDNTNSKIYVGGDFTTFQGVTQNRIVRLNMDGSIDNTFNIGTGFNSYVYCINLDNINQKIYVGGYFTTYKGSTQNYLIRLNMDGSKDNTFNIGTGFNYSVMNIIIDNTNSKLYVGGNFSTYKGITQNRLIRLNMDGTKDNTFNIGSGFNHNIYSFNIDTINQKIYAGGNFTTFNGTSRNRLARLNMDGSLDASFNIGTGLNSFFTTSSGILIDNEKNKIYITGDFTIYNGQPQKYLARLNMDGSLDNTFNIQLGTTAVTILQIEDIPIVSLEITGDDEVVNGNTLQLGIEYKPSNTTQTGVVWSSSDETKATVDSNGLVTAIADGSVVIRATSIVNGAISDTHNINMI